MLKKGSGFVPDFIPSKAKILFVFAAPERDDPAENRLLSGNLGWFRKTALLKSLNLEQHEVALSSIIRCYPGKDKFLKLAYPQAKDRISCEKLCRQYDNRSLIAGEIVPRGIINFDPNVFIITFDIEMLSAGSAFRHLILADIRKALRTINQGGRPAVLFGEHPAKMFAPYCFGPGQGGIKTWRGHIFNNTWKDLTIRDEDLKEISAKPNPFRRFNQTKKIKKPTPVALKLFVDKKVKNNGEEKSGDDENYN